MKIAFIVEGDPENNSLWSGTIKQIYNTLKKEHKVIPLDITCHSKLLNFYYRLKAKLTKLLTGKKFYSAFDKKIAIQQSKIVDRFLLNNSDVELIFCPAKCGSIAYVKTEKKIVYLTDATFKSMVDYYDYLTNISRCTFESGNDIEYKAINRSNLVICASSWAKESVVRDYGKDESQVKFIPFGANLLDMYKSKEKEISETINLLFCGVDWERKGGDIAINTLKSLKKLGIDAKLYLVGCHPPYEIKDKSIANIGFLDKNNDKELNKLVDLYSKMDFLLLPTKAEAAGIVFAEASMNGIVCVTYDTGGVGSYVVDGINGFKLPLGSSGEEFASLIADIFNDKQKYFNLRKSCRKYYEERLNYSVWLEDFNKALGEI